MSEEVNERDFMKACFNAVAGLEVKNESQAIAKEVILNEVENLTEENKQLKAELEMYENGVYYSSENDKLKEVIEEVRETLINSKEYKMANAMNLNAKQSVLVELLQILDKVTGE